MKTFLLIIAFATISFAQVTQEWVKRYNGSANADDEPFAIASDNNGNVYVAGRSIQTGNSEDFVTIKYNSEGTQQWLKTYNGTGNSGDAAFAITVDNNGNVYIAGRSQGGLTGTDFTTIKYNPNGDLLWVKSFSRLNDNFEDLAYAIAVDNNGDVYVTGYSATDNGSESYDFLTIKYSSVGQEQWVRFYNGIGNGLDIANNIAVDNNGSVYVAGTSKGIGADNNDFLIIKYDVNGNIVWERRYDGGTNQQDNLSKMKLDNSGNVYITGTSFGSITTIKYSSNGDILWIREYQEVGRYLYSTSLAVDVDGNIFISGYTLPSGAITSDYITIKYSDDGTEQWVRKYNTSENQNDFARDIAVDALGNVYVTGDSDSSSSVVDYATVMYNTDGDQIWVQRYNGPGNFVDAAAVILVNESAEIFVTGKSLGNNTGFDIATIKYRNQGIEISNPQAGDKWIAGEVDTIKWRGPKENGWEIFISDDDGFSYKSLNVILPADDSMFVWTPPDSLETSSYYRIKVIDVLNNTLFAVSEQFNIRAYDLVRLTSDDKYEVYKPSLHGWSVVNYSDYIWPSSWYNQYDYRTGEDPFTLQPYYNKFAILTRAESSDFPDWPTFVETFGIEKCYEVGFLSGDPYQPKQRAMEAWSIIKMDYAGACFGFPSSALLAFEQTSEFFSQNQLLQFTPTIFYLNSLIPIRKTIIKYFLYQSDATSLAYNNDKFTISVRETLEEIKDMLMDDNGPHSVLSLQPPEPGGHAVIPHKLVRDPFFEGQYKLYVYDPNSPGENREFIVLDSLGNTWQEFLDLDYGIASDGLFLGLPITHFLQVPILEPLEKSSTALSKNNANALADLSSVSLYTQTKSDLIIFSDTGDSLGFVSGNLIRNMENAGPIIPAVGGFTSPIGYTMPASNYSLWLSQFEDSLSTVLFSEDGILYRYERLNPQLNQIDKFTLGNGFSVFSDEEKEILLRTIGSNNKEIVYELFNLTIMTGDSLRTIHSLDDDLLVSNKGSNKSYGLRVHQLDPHRAIDFESYNISLSENTTHYLSLVDSLLTAIRILIDIGNDGTIDDTLYVANTVDIADEGSHLTPNSYNLAQNYPNPFNPNTTIQFSIPQRSNVTLKVYDVIGNEIATLVDEYKPVGSYEVEFNATQLSSGVYFYRLHAGSFIETKKMIILR